MRQSRMAIDWLPFPPTQYNRCVSACKCLCSRKYQNPKCVKRIGRSCLPKWPIRRPTATIRPTIGIWAIWTRWSNDDDTLNPVRRIQGYYGDDGDLIMMREDDEDRADSDVDLSEKAVDRAADQGRSCYLCYCD